MPSGTYTARRISAVTTSHSTATRSLLLREKVVRPDGSLLEVVIWQLPESSPERPHGLKYRLYFGRDGRCIVRYDNEAGKSDHRHVRGREVPYRFVSVERLLADCKADVERHGGEDA